LLFSCHTFAVELVLLLSVSLVCAWAGIYSWKREFSRCIYGGVIGTLRHENLATISVFETWLVCLMLLSLSSDRCKRCQCEGKSWFETSSKLWVDWSSGRRGQCFQSEASGYRR
jgi:hypothetical protein